MQLAGAVNGVPGEESVTSTVNEAGPAVSGVPVIAPVPAFNCNGVGSAPPVNANVYPAMPPAAVSDEEYSVPTCPSPAAQANESAGLIDRYDVYREQGYHEPIVVSAEEGGPAEEDDARDIAREHQ